ncbi:hypothetical protein GCK72_003749 [Caenorhabditis remanei]|uniref:F-box domain-containing protein n=1 Tax=Caenorhabditis remanei TaxID=31234 RepID=A0A6A5HAE4_CAERE|nr:hypothetical protein GCK72_003749 [Caenorhabditis remanei]KAF1763804.1 hypothetical protein GCK72_003749 [Caenorhabditis remanei]
MDCLSSQDFTFFLGVLAGILTSIGYWNVLNIIRERKFEKKISDESTNPFKLNKMPLLMIRKTVQLMSVSERIDLAFTSQQMKRKIQNLTAQIPYSVHFKGDETYIEMEGEDVRIHSTREGNNQIIGDVRQKKTLSKWINENNPNLSSLKNTINNLNRIQELVPPCHLTLHFYPNQMEETENIPVILELPEFRNWVKIVLHVEGIRTLDTAFQWLDGNTDLVVDQFVIGRQPRRL